MSLSMFYLHLLNIFLYLLLLLGHGLRFLLLSLRLILKLQPDWLPHNNFLISKEILSINSILEKPWKIKDGCAHVVLRPQDLPDFAPFLIFDLLPCQLRLERAVNHAHYIEVFRINLQRVSCRDQERQGLLPDGPCVSSPLDQFLPNVAALGGRNTIQLLEVQVQRKLIPTFLRALNQCIDVTNHIVLLLVLIIDLDICVL